MTASLAGLSLDLDNLWSYLKTHGDAGWEARPTYLPTVVPLVLDLLDELGLRITFFVVGADARQDVNAEVLRQLNARGHDVGSHSFEHEPWLHRYEPTALRDELDRAEDAIEAVCHVRPSGFRGPGYSWSPALLMELATRGYQYDASSLPTVVGPLARAYYFRSARLTREQRMERAALFGSFWDGFRPVAPYRWRLPGGWTLLEIPVTTVPALRLPFHLSYLLFLARRSEALALAYLDLALWNCMVARSGVSFLLHPLDFLGGDEVPGLRFFPGMDLAGATKRRFATRVLRRLAARFRPVPLAEYAAALADRPLPTRAPDSGS